MTAPEPTVDLDALEALLADATPGPWEFRPRRGFGEHEPATIGFHDTAGYFVMFREGTWGTTPDGELVAAAVNALPALIVMARERDRILSLVGDWMAEYGPGSKGERAFGPQVISISHVYASVVDGEGHPPFSAFPDYEGSLLAVTAERDAARADLAALRERVEAVLADARYGDVYADDLRAALDGDPSQ